jgi:hypothetical protein
MPEDDWISLHDAALFVYRALYSDEDQRAAVDRIRHVIRYAAQGGKIARRLRGDREGFSRREFELWAAKRYPGSVRGVLNATGTARLAFTTHRATISFHPLPPDLLNMPNDVQLLQDMVKDYWGRASELQRNLDEAHAEIAAIKSDRDGYKARDAARREEAQAAGRKGGRPRKA